MKMEEQNMNQKEHESYREYLRSFRGESEQELDKFFYKISEVLNSFAEFHGLEIVKYGCRFPMWQFMFRHPKGDLATIEVRKESDNEVRICPVWWIDNSKTKIRSSFSSEGEVSSLDADKVREILEAALTCIVSWDESVLIRKGELSREITRGVIKKDVEQYSFPKNIKIIDKNDENMQRFL